MCIFSRNKKNISYHFGNGLKTHDYNSRNPNKNKGYERQMTGSTRILKGTRPYWIIMFIRDIWNYAALNWCKRSNCGNDGPDYTKSYPYIVAQWTHSTHKICNVCVTSVCRVLLALPLLLLLLKLLLLLTISNHLNTTERSKNSNRTPRTKNKCKNTWNACVWNVIVWTVWLTKTFVLLKGNYSQRKKMSQTTKRNKTSNKKENGKKPKS